MGYELEKDKILEEVRVDDDGQYIVRVCQYDGGKVKLALMTKTQYKDKKSGNMVDTWTTKAGRITLDMADEFGKIMINLSGKYLDYHDSDEL